MEVVDNIKQAIDLLKEVEEYNQQLNGENGLISVCDQKIDYWEHYIELEHLTISEVWRIAKEIKNQRILRRKYKNDAELIKVFKDNEDKLRNPGYRDILLNQICKTDSKQKNAKYGYNAYTDEERDYILGRKGDK